MGKTKDGGGDQNDDRCIENVIISEWVSVGSGTQGVLFSVLVEENRYSSRGGYAVLWRFSCTESSSECRFGDTVLF